MDDKLETRQQNAGLGNGVLKSSQQVFDRIKNEAIREEFQVFNLNERRKYYNQRWKEHLERMSDSRLSKQAWKYNLYDTGV